MNRETIRRLANRIEACDEVTLVAHHHAMGPSFTMAAKVYGCGAPACMVGHCNEMQGRQPTVGAGLLADELGIPHEQVYELCMPQHDTARYERRPGEHGFITKKRAVAVLRNLADTGKVDWSILAAADDSAQA